MTQGHFLLLHINAMLHTIKLNENEPIQLNIINNNNSRYMI